MYTIWSRRLQLVHQPENRDLVGLVDALDFLFLLFREAATATRFFDKASAANPSVKLFAPSALSDPSFARGLSATVRHLYVTAPGFLGQDLPATGSKFVSDFTDKYGHAPDPQAIFGYEAMSAVLAVLREAGSNANNRSTVVHDAGPGRNRLFRFFCSAIEGAFMA